MIRRIRQIEKGVIVFDLLYFRLQQNMPNFIYVRIDGFHSDVINSEKSK